MRCRHKELLKTFNGDYDINSKRETYRFQKDADKLQTCIERAPQQSPANLLTPEPLYFDCCCGIAAKNDSTHRKATTLLRTDACLADHLNRTRHGTRGTGFEESETTFAAATDTAAAASSMARRLAEEEPCEEDDEDEDDEEADEEPHWLRPLALAEAAAAVAAATYFK